MSATTPTRTAVLTTLAMLAFAGNSLLCRMALKHTAIDPASFTSLRLASGALVLGLLVAWRGRTAGGDPTAVTAGNFLRAAPLSLVVSALMAAQARCDVPGLLLALASGALASGAGYAVWYTALRGLTATRAAILQLSVPVLASAGGVLLLGEALTQGLLLASLAVLGGVLLVILARAPARTLAPTSS